MECQQPRLSAVVRASHSRSPRRGWTRPYRWTPPQQGTLGHVRVRPRSLVALGLRTAAVDAAGAVAELLLLPVVVGIGAWTAMPAALLGLLLLCYAAKHLNRYQAGQRG